MSEYIVRWKHTRYGAVVDGVIKHVRSGEISVSKARQMLNVYSLYTISTELPGITPSQHGGKTWCGIYSIHQSEPDDPDGSTYLTCDASAETIYSWRDQFDRHVGRLYSLALALCELPDLTLDDIDLWDALGTQTRNYCKPYQFEQLCGYIILKDKAVVKHICAEIIASWKVTRKAMKRTETNAGIRSISSCVQGGDSDTMPCGHPRSAMVRGEYWGKDAEGRENYTWYCGACSDEASHA